MARERGNRMATDYDIERDYAEEMANTSAVILADEYDDDGSEWQSGYNAGMADRCNGAAAQLFLVGSPESDHYVCGYDAGYDDAAYGTVTECQQAETLAERRI